MSFFKLEPTEIEEKRKNDSTLFLDVREAYEFEEFNIGGKNIPMNEVLSRSEEFNSFEEIVICCASGKRSNVVAHHLSKKLPHLKVYSIIGGIHAIENQLS